MRAQRGVTVVVCLVMMLLVMVLGASAARLGVQDEQSARAERDREVAFRAAEEALADAERAIDDGSAVVAHGACEADPAWQRADLGGEAGGACTTEYGATTGAAMATGQGALPRKKPRYIVELLACHQPGADASAPQACYRVTAIGFGPTPGVEVVLQSVYLPGP
ncbi:pilus assembly protein PilX [Duganella sp. Leaf126]|uniref:pilus assembly PilX family protein n=1 Tax=Duganella sp. Leaf126 TaxID=1736266 RepID=UPI000701D1C3|nr:pilus assembly protein [Duganella sp. Leaf126]KQQ42505.1 pilus assembly protein PilX [Duganella sp. Leaf126]